MLQDNPLMLKAVLEAASRKKASPQRKFIHQYRNDPVAFVHDCFLWRDDQGPTFYQEEILAQLPIHHRISARGPRGLGKTTLSSWAVLWYAITRDLICQADGSDWKVPTTAGAWRQLIKFLWPEIHKWARRLDWSKIPMDQLDSRTQLLAQSMKLKTGEALAIASDTPDLIEGSHADFMLYLFDEAKAIPHVIFDSVEGSFSGAGKLGQEAIVMAMSTPGERSGRFYDIHRRAPGYENWWVRHVTLEECMKAGRITPEWLEQTRRQWGESSPVFQAQVLGEFPEQGENTLINLSWIERARQNELINTGEILAGVDVARFGDDNSVELIVQDALAVPESKESIFAGVVLSIDYWQGHDTMQTTGRVIANKVHACVDTIGVGAGVYDRLSEQNFSCTPINVGESASDSEHFLNLRAELYWRLRDDFRENRLDLTRLSMEDYDRLSGELSAILYEYTSKGQIKIEAKEETKKKLNGSSPDFADALMLTRSQKSAMPGIGVV